jgi:hypothetical protein
VPHRFWPEVLDVIGMASAPFGTSGALYVADCQRGRIWRIHYGEDATSSAGRP